MTDLHLFVYGTLRSGGGAAGLLRGCERVATATLPGTLYDMGAYPALTLDGEGRVEGEVWRCPPEALDRLDEYEGVAEGLFRRVKVDVGGRECWTYAAGPALESPRRRPGPSGSAGARLEPWIPAFAGMTGQPPGSRHLTSTTNPPPPRLTPERRIGAGRWDR